MVSWKKRPGARAYCACPATCQPGQAHLTPFPALLLPGPVGPTADGNVGMQPKKRTAKRAHTLQPHQNARPWDPLEAFGISARPRVENFGVHRHLQRQIQLKDRDPKQTGRGGPRGISD